MPRRVQVHEHLDGHLSVHYAGRCLTITAAPLEAPKLRARQGARGGGTVAADSQTPSSAVVLLPPATTVELGESTARSAEQSTARRRPAADHGWCKPFLLSKRTKSLNT
jgi:hypothetical protein